MTNDEIKNSLRNTANLMQRVLEILSPENDSILQEFNNTKRICLQCNNLIICNTPPLVKGASVQVSGKKPQLTGNATIHWSVTCQKCHHEGSFGINYTYDYVKGFEINNFNYC